MATADVLTFYSNKSCPFCQRVEIAFSEAGIKPYRYEVDLSNKPEWYAPKISASGKVPAMAIGGPKVNPETPSPESTKLAESLVLLEYVAELYPQAGLLPSTPLTRAKARFFIEAISSKVIPGYAGFIVRGEGPEKLFAALEEVQALLHPTGFAISEQFSIADAAIAPFLGRLDVQLGNDLGKYAPGAGIAAHKEIFEGERFKRLQKYYKALTSRPSWKATFDIDFLIAHSRERFPRA